MYVGCECPNCENDDWEIEIEGNTVSDTCYEIVNCPVCGAKLELEIEVRATLLKKE